MDSALARRTTIAVSIDGADVSDDINKYLLQMTYTDNEEDYADDLQISLDDRERIWLDNWLDNPDGTKGADISAVIIQRNFNSDGNDSVLPCGAFEIDTVDGSGPPSGVSIRATSLPHTSTLRTATHTKAWEKIKLSGIAGEIASNNGMTLMYESSYDPLYDRKEQVDLSDIAFLQGLCYNAGISLKASGGIIVLFDAAEYEQKPTVTEIRRGAGNVLGWRLGTKANDAKYGSSRVTYTDPQTGQTHNYTFTPPGASGAGQVLRINERVRSRAEARDLAKRRLRQKNKSEYKAEFSLVGDTRLVAGVTVELVGWGMFNGKYIIETAAHTVTGSGYTLTVTLRRVLEGY